MRSVIMMPLTLSILLAGCGSEGGAPQQETTQNALQTAPTGADYQAQLQSMSEGQRNAVFIRAIRDADRPCQHVERSSARGEINGAPAWTAVCDGVEWTIIIGDAGVVQVTNEAELRAAGVAAEGS